MKGIEGHMQVATNAGNKWTRFANTRRVGVAYILLLVAHSGVVIPFNEKVNISIPSEGSICSACNVGSTFRNRQDIVMDIASIVNKSLVEDNGWRRRETASSRPVISLLQRRQIHCLKIMAINVKELSQLVIVPVFVGDSLEKPI